VSPADGLPLVLLVTIPVIEAALAIAQENIIVEMTDPVKFRSDLIFIEISYLEI
jgi:hypothetical protein